MKKAIVCTSIIAALLVADVQAGTGAGNGGGAIVCRDPINNNRTFHVDLYDLWEGKVVHGLNIVPTSSEVTVDQIVARAVERLVGIHDLFASDVANALKGVQTKIQEQLNQPPKGVYLPDTNDSNRRLMPKYCPARPEIRPEYEQVVNYTDEGEILLDRELFQLLDKDEVAAIYLHEAIYKALRDQQRETDSVATRQIVATLMSDASDEQLTQVLKELLRSTYKAGNLRKQLETMAYRFINRNDVAGLRRLFHAEYHLYGETIRLPDSTPRMLEDALYHANNRELVELILDHAGPDFDIDIQAFAIAVEWSDPSIVKRLLEQFPDFDLTLKSVFGESPAHQAIQRGRVEVLRVLLDDERIDPMKLLYDAIQTSYFSPRLEQLEIFKLIVGNSRFDLRRRYESIWSFPLSRILSKMPESNAEGFQIAIELTKTLLSYPQYDLFASGHGKKAVEEARKKGNIPLAELIETALSQP